MLTIFIIVILVLASILIFIPRKGIIAKISLWKNRQKRIMLEDSLKLIYNCELSGNSCNIKNLAKLLNNNESRAIQISDDLKSLNLISKNNNSIFLTNEGKEYALSVIRIHRLWEHFLSEKTGIEETEWHSNAEKAEHLLTIEEANDLAASLNNPVFDPHGDPIPQADGNFVSVNGKEIFELEIDEFARIIHVEDEPEEIFKELNSIGISQGVIVQLVNKKSDSIILRIEGTEHSLSISQYKNILTFPVQKEKIFSSFKSLSSLKQDEEAVIVGISKSIKGLQRRRLMDFGIVPGSRIKAKLVSTGGDPVAYRIRGTDVALRKNQSDYIYIDEVRRCA